MRAHRRCDNFCEDLNQFVSIDDLCELRRLRRLPIVSRLGCRALTASQWVLAENTVATFGVTHEDEPDVDEPFRSWVGR